MIGRGKLLSGGYMRKSFRDSLKLLEADIGHANTLASDFLTEYDGACLQMRMSYRPAAHLFLFLVQWTDCNLAGALGLIRIMIYKVHIDGTTTMSTLERKGSIKEFYVAIFPSLLQLQKGITNMEDKKQKVVCMERYRRRDEDERKQLSEIDVEREEECGICMEMNNKIILPRCSHAMCIKCYREWNSRSQSCPFCRDSLRDLWVFVNSRDVVDMTMVTREDIRRLIMYIKKLPEVVPETVFDACDSHDRLPMCPRHLVDFHQFLNLVSICSSSLILSIVWR
ncbi:E3 ubiquitin-protein ligase AIRP2-like [Musa acuminata AAA Group]|uniref:E3 ubiquitin-protein ligase AIRP2-like n=1 Tax=Musa acuminata AAA Group TaxID=214697 RepID=UPI0031CE4626